MLEAPRLVEQLRYCSVLEAVRVARAGYPATPSRGFARRYRCAAPSGWVYKPPKLDDALDAAKKAALHAAKALVLVLAPGAELRVEPATKVIEDEASPSARRVFLREDAFEALEALLARRTAEAAVRVQKAFRGREARTVPPLRCKLAHFVQGPGAPQVEKAKAGSLVDRRRRARRRRC